MRFIDIINAGSATIAENNKVLAENEVKNLKKELKFIKKQPKSRENSRKITEIYEKIDKYCFYPEIVCIVCDNKNDLHLASNGLKINGYEYKRLLGTPGGIKNSTIIFVSTHTRDGVPLIDELVRRIDNGRDLNKELVTAKLEAYKALVCSSSVPVSMPRGVVVVDDCITKFKDNFIKLDDSDGGEPKLTIIESGDVEVDISDGFGLISPALSKQWSDDVGEDFLVAGFCIRNSFCKGMAFTFDFHKFAREVAKSNQIVDAWGIVHNVLDINLILTTSMLKLWNSYRDIDDYIENCNKNDYTFSVSKITPKKLEDERYLNYQFIQSYHLTDEQIDELIAPTVNELLEVLGGDINKTILFLRGVGITEENADIGEDDFVRALMIDEEMMNDPYVMSKLYYLIRNRIDMAKIGKLKVKGNFSILSGDPYCLCQSIWGMEVTGLLEADCIYSKYWVDKNVDKVACFRAPMSCHNNIRVVNVVADDEMLEWYKYMDTVTILNGWDMITHALNGCDFDSDIVLTTNNNILIDNHRKTFPILCVQRDAEKTISTELDFIKSNIGGFGDEIGSITNNITSMTDIQADYSKDDDEYKVLEYRIMCGQLFQQDAIDKIKGIITNPMPLYWHNAAAAKGLDYEHITADKKPYFMTYIYPTEKKKYSEYMKKVEAKSIMLTRRTLEENIKLASEGKLKKEEKTFMEWYYRKLPVNMSNSVMNRIAWRVEKIFKDFRESRPRDFNFEILKSGIVYDKRTFNMVAEIYNEYLETNKEFIVKASSYKISPYELSVQKAIMNKNFLYECFKICSSEDELCEILVDCCYGKNNSKYFVWQMCSNVLLKNLSKRNNHKMKYVEADECGDIEYCSMKFKERYKCIADLYKQEEHIENGVNCYGGDI